MPPTASPLPQFLRKSTQGISYSLFALVMLGNTLYGLSVLLKNPDMGESEGSYLLHHLPWLVGSLGVLLLDTVVSFLVCGVGGAGQLCWGFLYFASLLPAMHASIPPVCQPPSQALALL